MGAKDASETARQREVFSYYQPPVQFKPGVPVLSPQASHDAALTAFAQLGALRLGAKRGMISLVAGDLQYVIAEATQTLSLQSNTIHDEADGLWMGETVLWRRDDPCSVAMDLFTGVVEGERSHLLVSDLSADDRFSHMGAVSGPPSMKFMVAVPLVSARGVVIGSFYVVDDRPRNELSNTQLQFMKDVASTIMAHLDAKRVKQQHQRAERMIRGLGLYVEGKSSLREWWLNTGHKSDDLEVTEKSRRGENLEQQADRKFGIQDSPDDLAAAAIASVPSSSQKGQAPLSGNGLQGIINHAPSRRRPQYSRAGRSDTTANSTLLSTAPDTTFTQEAGASDPSFTKHSSTSNREPIEEAVEYEQLPAINPPDEASGARLQEAVLSEEVKESFSRASNLIRESIAVDGALFLDASVGTFGGSSTKADMAFSGPTARKDRCIPPATSSSDEARQLDGSAEGPSQKTCGILGYSTSTRSSLNMHEPFPLHLSVTEEFLRKLVRRYPHGGVFNFDDDGSLSSSEDEIRKTVQSRIDGHSEESHRAVEDKPPQQRKKRKISREAEGKEILRILPSARRVAFFPLWDSHKERWFAGSMIWTTNATRILNPDEDLTYLASFGNSIMAEVSRLNALVSSQVKNSFVSSISHELRSPLHGVLASVEFLQDSPLNALQQEMVSIIGTCGRTLLDTLNHVLDFTRLRRSTTDKPGSKNSMESKRTRAGSGSLSSLSTERAAAVDLRVLTEEVVQVVYAGSEFGRSQSIKNKQSALVDIESSPPATQSISPMIILNLEWQKNWRFEIDPGAWRRLVMNIFGNALKYTETGFVRISVGISDKKGSLNDTSPSMVTLSVNDSGKGISKEFLNHHLYTPFAQEDSLAVGSGLGLSIVRQIVVSELGGNITIDSELDSGTEVAISLPLTLSEPPVVSNSGKDLISQVRGQVQGMKACLVGFDVFPNIVDEPTGILSVEAKWNFYFKDSLTALLNNWFGMKVVLEATLKPIPATISFVTESVFNEILSPGLLAGEIGKTPHRKSILLVLCAKHFESYPTVFHTAFEVIYVQQPIGPHKLATVLTTCLASLMPQDDKPIEAGLSVNPDGEASEDMPIDDRSLISLTQHLTRSQRRSSQTSPTTSILPTTPPLLSPELKPSKPLGRPAFQTRTSSASSNPTITSKSPSNYILLVEDNAINLKILVTYVKKLAIDYATAENGSIALREYQGAERPFSLVLMDISMPVMDGLEASRKIRLFEQESKRDRVPIVAITGAASESEQQEAFSSGIDQFLTKPVSLKVLKEVIDAYIPLGR